MTADDDATTNIYVSPFAGRSLDAPQTGTVRIARPQPPPHGDDAPISTTQWLPLPTRDELLSQPPLPLAMPSPVARRDSSVSLAPSTRPKRVDTELVVWLLAGAVLWLGVVATLLMFV